MEAIPWAALNAVLILYEEVSSMKKLIVGAIVLLMAAPVFAAKDEREEDRVKEAGTVLKEILNVPDDIPQDLLNKAECVVILPSVKKA